MEHFLWNVGLKASILRWGYFRTATAHYIMYVKTTLDRII